MFMQVAQALTMSATQGSIQASMLPGTPNLLLCSELQSGPAGSSIAASAGP
jgi:hypothetical protein